MAGEVGEAPCAGLDRALRAFRDDKYLPRSQVMPPPVHLDDARAEHPDDEHLDLPVDVPGYALPRLKADEIGVEIVGENVEDVEPARRFFRNR